jgi:hypothetical protein
MPLLPDIKSKWNAFANTGVLIFSVAASFMIEPPLLSLSEESKVNWFAKFLITALIALFTIPMLVRSRKKDYTHWFRLAVIGLCLTLIFAGTYTYLLEKWSVPFYNHRLVIGHTMSKTVHDEEMAFLQSYSGPYGDTEAFVKSRQGNTNRIWPSEELNNAYTILHVLYIITFITVTIFVVSIIQSIYCYEKEDCVL